jgi:hypothetical protein
MVNIISMHDTIIRERLLNCEEPFGTQVWDILYILFLLNSVVCLVFTLACINARKVVSLCYLTW